MKSNFGKLIILPLSLAFFSCSGGGISTPTPNQEGDYIGVSTNPIIGVVSVSTEGLFGGRTDNGIERRLRNEAKKVYGNSASIINIREEGNTAYADVIK